MKNNLLTILITLVISQIVGCSSTSKNVSNNTVAPIVPISEQRIASNDFKRQGVKIYYSLLGNLEAIEVVGYAPVWGNSENALRESYRVAELEAKKSLNDFVNKESISSNVSVNMISQNIEHARDQKKSNSSSSKNDNSNEINAVDEIVDNAKTTQNTNNQNSEVRNDALRIASKVSTTISTSNKGIFGGLYLVESQPINDGKNVRVLMRWDKKNEAPRLELRGLMGR
jgi:hypothetical protein